MRPILAGAAPTSCARSAPAWCYLFLAAFFIGFFLAFAFAFVFIAAFAMVSSLSLYLFLSCPNQFELANPEQFSGIC